MSRENWRIESVRSDGRGRAGGKRRRPIRRHRVSSVISSPLLRTIERPCGRRGKYRTLHPGLYWSRGKGKAYRGGGGDAAERSRFPRSGLSHALLTSGHLLSAGARGARALHPRVPRVFTRGVSREGTNT